MIINRKLNEKLIKFVGGGLVAKQVYISNLVFGVGLEWDACYLDSGVWPDGTEISEDDLIEIEELPEIQSHLRDLYYKKRDESNLEMYKPGAVVNQIGTLLLYQVNYVSLPLVVLTHLEDGTSRTIDLDKEAQVYQIIDMSKLVEMFVSLLRQYRRDTQ